MAIEGVVQPEVIQIDRDLRLVRFQGEFAFAITWYQDVTLVKLVDNKETPYDLKQLECMYTYLDRAGELYFIEAVKDGEWRKAGDVTLCANGDLPIVLIPSFQHRGIGSKVLECLIHRAGKLQIHQLEVRIYKFNQPSQGLFQKHGFEKTGETESEYIYTLEINKGKCEEKDESINR